MSTFTPRFAGLTKFVRFIAWLGLACSVNSIGYAQGRIECDSVQSKILKSSVRYCVLLPSSYDSSQLPKGMPLSKTRRFPVLYYLHGIGDSERSLIDTGASNLIQDLAEQHKIGEFLIVTPEGGRSFYINSRDGRSRYGEFFIREFIPAIERRYRVRTKRSSRGIMGISMGGYGALRFAFANPQLFTSVSAQSAALMPESPQGLNLAMNSGTRLAGLLGNVFGNPIDISFWRKNSPLNLAKTNATMVKKLKIYFDCGAQDEYGFDRGARALHEELLAEKIKHEFHLYPGGHNLTFFLQHLGASIEFHSQAFDGVP